MDSRSKRNEFGDDGYISTCTTYESHIYNEITDEKRNTTRGMKSFEKMTRGPTSKVIHTRFCVIWVLGAVLVSFGIAFACFMAYKNIFLKNCDNERNERVWNNNLKAQSKELKSTEHGTLLYMRSTCPDDWYRYENSCYKIYEDRKTWIKARAFCLNVDAELISIHNNKEATLILEHLNVKSERILWIGLNDIKEENVFVWSDGSQTSFTKWNGNEPNNFNNFEHCVEVSKDSGLWNDDSCYLQRGFICKMNLTNKCGDGSWLLFNDHCYLFKNMRVSWHAASIECFERNSNLISIDSTEEHYFVTSQTSSLSGRFWIGLRRDYKNSGDYLWPDGKVAKNIPWAGGYPKTSRACVYLGYHGNFLNHKCKVKLDGFVCKKKGG